MSRSRSPFGGATSAALLIATIQLLTLSRASTCRYSYTSKCQLKSKFATFTVNFQVDETSSNADFDSYPMTATFVWGVENTTVTDTYEIGPEQTIEQTYYYDDYGYYTTGFLLAFGDGAGGCEGNVVEELMTLELISTNCNFDGVTPPPTPAPPSPAPTAKTEAPTLEPTESSLVPPTLKPSLESTTSSTLVGPLGSPEPVVTTTLATAPTVTTGSSVAESTTSTSAATAPSTTTETSTSVGTTSSTGTATLSPSQRVVSKMTLFNSAGLDETALNQWQMKTIQQIMRHSEDEADSVTLENVSQNTGSRRHRFLLRQLGSRNLAGGEDGPLTIDFDAVVESKNGLSQQEADDIVASGFSTNSRQAEYIYALKSADSVVFSNVERMAMVVDGKSLEISEISEALSGAQGQGSGDGGGGTSMGVIIGAAAGGAALIVFIMIGSIFYTKRQKQPSSKGTGSHTKETKGMADSEIIGNEWSMRNTDTTTDAHTHTSAYLGTIESREGEDDVSTLGDPYFGEAVNALDTATVAESMVSSDMLALGVKRRVPGSNASRMGDATIATGFTSGVASAYPMFADDTTLDDAYQTPAVGYEQEDDDDYERIVVAAPPGKLGVVIDNPSGNIPFVHAIKESSVLHGKVYVGDLLLAVDEVDCRGMHSLAVSKLISKRSENPARTLKLLRKSS